MSARPGRPWAPPVRPQRAQKMKCHFLTPSPSPRCVYTILCREKWRVTTITLYLGWIRFCSLWQKVQVLVSQKPKIQVRDLLGAWTHKRCLNLIYNIVISIIAGLLEGLKMVSLMYLAKGLAVISPGCVSPWVLRPLLSITSKIARSSCSTSSHWMNGQNCQLYNGSWKTEARCVLLPYQDFSGTSLVGNFLLGYSSCPKDASGIQTEGGPLFPCLLSESRLCPADWPDVYPYQLLMQT